MSYHLIYILNASESECDHPSDYLVIPEYITFKKTLIQGEKTDETAAYQQPLIHSTFSNHNSQNCQIKQFLKSS